MIIKSLLGLAVGVAGAIEAGRIADRVRARFRPSGITGALLNKVNRELEENRASSPQSRESSHL